MNTVSIPAAETTPPKRIHLICNAHLDPVWLWQWNEGAAESLSTFRTAVELCEQNPGFVFNHNEVILYEWVRQYEPCLFERIRKMAQAGRWHIMGGWFLQPDCNLCSGESFVRQILAGKLYFRKHFGAEVRTAINFDSYGHSAGLPQILARAGFDSYLFGRPMPDLLKLPGEDFIWEGCDGSTVMASRFRGWYNTPLGKAAEVISQRIEDQKQMPIGQILWGVGNHGGGPSRIDLAQVNELIANRKDVQNLHSTPEQYFDDLRKIRAALPAWRGDLNPYATGSYTSWIRVKQKHRALENALFGAEKMAAAAAMQGLMEYPCAELHTALEDLLTSQFHDILPGASTQPVEEDSLQQLDHGLYIAEQVRTRAFFALSAGQPQAAADEIPILVYNPHPYPLRQTVECEFNMPDLDASGRFRDIQVYHQDSQVPAQVEREISSIAIDWRKRVAFLAELAPGMNRFNCRWQSLPAKPPIMPTAHAGWIVFQTDELQVQINLQTGLIDKLDVGGKECLGPGAFAPLLIMDNSDCENECVRRYSEVGARFRLLSPQESAAFAGVSAPSLEPVRVIEDGPARTVVEALLGCGSSRICQRYCLPKQGTEIEISLRVYWNEIDRMLKLSLPLAHSIESVCGQIAYGAQDFPCSGDEFTAQKWLCVEDSARDLACSIINDGIYAFSAEPQEVRLTLLRSAAYASYSSSSPARQALPQDRHSPRMEQGERRFRFWFNAGPMEQRRALVDREALAHNESPYVLSFNPGGAGKTPGVPIELSDPAIQLTALKKAEAGDGWIIRIFEPTGKARKAVMRLPLHNLEQKLEFTPFEIKTFKLALAGSALRAVNLLEE